jgi:hypothetical protein
LIQELRIRQLFCKSVQRLRIDPPGVLVLLNRFQVHDTHLENLACALKSEMDQGFVTGRLDAESIGMVMACQLLKGTV